MSGELLFDGDVPGIVEAQVLTFIELDQTHGVVTGLERSADRFGRFGRNLRRRGVKLGER